MSNMPRREEENRRLELIPMVDIVFLLLIYFLVTMAVKMRIDPSIARPEERANEVGQFLVDLPESKRQLGVSDSLTATDMLVVVESLQHNNGHFNIFFLDKTMTRRDSILWCRETYEQLIQTPRPWTGEFAARVQALEEQWRSHLFTASDNIAINDFQNDSYGTYRQELRATIEQYRDKRESNNELKEIANVLIEADRNVYYRVVYDLFEEFDQRGIRSVDMRFKVAH